MLNLLQFNRNMRSIRRSRQIIRILIKYGFDHVLEMMNLSHLVARGKRLLRRNQSLISQMTPPVRMRLAIEELGPTFVKLGQLLSTRPDLIPASYLKEFAKLQDNVPPFPFKELFNQISLELSRDPYEIFQELDPEPLAAASIAQVHRARLHDGQRVVIKVRRPGILETVETDIDLMMSFALLAERHIPGADLYDPVGIVKEFARTIRREMDLAREGHTIEKFAENFKNDPTLYFPKVHREATTKGVLTMEYIDGIKVNDLDALRAAGMDLKAIATRGANTFLRMVLQHGFFHGDPHPGNVLILPGNIICLLDYGMVGRLDHQLKTYLADILMAIVSRNVDDIINLLVYSGEITDQLDTRGLRRELSEFIDSYYEVPLREIEIGHMLMDLIEIITAFRIKLQPDLVLLAKSLVTVEGMGRELDPDFDMVSILRPYMETVVKDRFSAGAFTKGISEISLSYLHLVRTLPRDIKEFLGRLNRNSFKIDLEHRGLERFIRELDKSINRLSSSLIISALIVGSSIVMQIDKGPYLFGFPVFAFMGYTIAAFIGFWWIIAILRSGRL